jgi:hypothetical protein
VLGPLPGFLWRFPYIHILTSFFDLPCIFRVFLVMLRCDLLVSCVAGVRKEYPYNGVTQHLCSGVLLRYHPQAASN